LKLTFFKMQATEIIEQKVFFKGLINSIDINPEEFLLPLQEVVVNSIQSIEDKGNVETGRIIIELIRKNETTLDFKDETHKDCNPIIGITVKDNRIGFTSSRFEAFKTPFTDFGAKKHGCKGIGRYTVLACFGSMDIISFYTEEDKEHCRLLRFDNGKGLQKINDESIEFPKENY